MKIVKKLLLFFFGTLFLFIIAGVALTYFYKDEIVAKVKTDINKNFNAVVDFGHVDLSLI